MEQASPPAGANTARVFDVLRRYWGYTSLRPLQAEAIDAALAQRDSLVVLPTGGGKSLCYQVPPMVAGGTDLVVSPLISLMKDQVDGLWECGYPAAALHSGLSAEERRAIEFGLEAGEYKLLFVAPERLVGGDFLQIAKRLNIRRFAIDEAHCISQWGHDFRPEYRQLAMLREHFPEASLHAFTATATPRVRQDIIRQLGLKGTAELVGVFDRPNLVYRVIPQVDLHAQTVEVLRRHAGEAAIVYCLSRKDTEAMARTLKDAGIRAAHYHAGLDAEQRRRTQEAFSEEELDVVVATVAFGMGIDRSNVRCVLHAALPKSVEHYQQETGRAGRDGLEAECVLLYTAADVMRWESLIQRSSEGVERSADVVAAQRELLRQMQRFASGPVCRHKSLSEYFGQAYEQPQCGACDVCLNEVEGIEDGTVTAQKILSCVARTGERFGVGYVAEVLIGSNTEAIRRNAHDQLSTYALMQGSSKKELMSLVFQLVDQGLVARTPGDMPILRLNDASWRILRGQQEVRLVRPKKKAPARTRLAEKSMEGVDQGLLDHLRGWRREIARQHGRPAFVIFDDNTLLDLARVRPTRKDSLRQVRGIGEKRLMELGPGLIDAIQTYCRQTQLSTNVLPAGESRAAAASATAAKRGSAKEAAFAMFASQCSIDEVATAIERARSTTLVYLSDYIVEQQPASIDIWVDDETYRQVARAVEAVAGDDTPRLKPIFEHLGGKVPFETIRLVVCHLQVRG